MFAFTQTSFDQVMYSFGAVGYQDRFYTINGNSISDEYSTEFENTFSWTSTAIPYPSFSGSFATEILVPYQTLFMLENVVYIIKPSIGITSLNYKALLKYDLSAHQYLDTSEYESTSNVFQKGSCVAYNPILNIFYSIGGSSTTDEDPIATVEIYNLTSDEWMTGTSLLEPRYAFGCAMDHNSQYVYTFGGQWETGNERNNILKFDVADDSWSLLASPTLKSYVHVNKCLLFIDKIYCISGYSYYSSQTVTDVNIFNPSNETMDTSYSLNTGRIYFGLFSYGNCIYVAGGLGIFTIEYFCIDIDTDPPSYFPTFHPSSLPTNFPSSVPTNFPSSIPTNLPSTFPTNFPSSYPTNFPSSFPTIVPSVDPSTFVHAFDPTIYPSMFPSDFPSMYPSVHPSFISPTTVPTFVPTNTPVTVEQPTLMKDLTSNFNDNSVSSLMIFMVAFAGLVFILLIVALFIVWYLRKRKKRRLFYMGENGSTLKIVNGQLISMKQVELPVAENADVNVNGDKIVADFGVVSGIDFVQRRILSVEDTIILSGNATAGAVGWNEEFQ